MNNSKERAQRAKQITWLGFWGNLVLTAFKLIAGILGRSSAMIADAIHSISDFATDVVVVVSLSMSNKPKDHNHRYGHGKIETMATLLIGVVLLFVGLGLMYSGANKVYAWYNGENIPSPGMIALYAALTSIVVKEIMFRLTIKTGKEINSQAVIANAWHHRSDSFSSIGTVVGIAGAIFLGDRWTVLDPIAAALVSVFILKISVSIIKETLLELIETSLPRKDEKEIMQIIAGVNGVHHPHDLKTRKIGNNIAIEIHIYVENSLNITQAHDIATEIETLLMRRYGSETHVSVHTEPLSLHKKEKIETFGI